MKPWLKLDSSDVPDGSDQLQLWQRDAEFSIRLKRGGELMNSRAFASERALADLICPRLADRATPRVLVGGLGLGHTLAAALAGLPTEAEVVVAELSPAVVRWNRGPLAHLASHPLLDARVQVHVGDVGALLRQPGRRWDAVLLDVDNGPEGLTRDDNDWLYSTSGLTTTARSLRPGGVLGVWSAHPSPAFRRRLQATGLSVEEHQARARAATGSVGSAGANKRGAGGKGPRHIVWLATAAM